MSTLVYKKTETKNKARELKIKHKVDKLVTKAVNLIDQYMIGEPVEFVTDSKGNEYISVTIGPTKHLQIDKKKHQAYIDNQKTKDIFSSFYTEMKKKGFVACQYENKKSWEIEGWVLVKEVEQ